MINQRKYESRYIKIQHFNEKGCKGKTHISLFTQFRYNVILYMSNSSMPIMFKDLFHEANI
ncbi:unnamed protein product [Moneuplotes crassus]|uniref:Uncharacterized protein n=1 Tax=Euplotes crassus TaxID=5936 RepID=A0AAD1XZG2_EUPCR|nr:unnamed protein product [Moneuplotes crassus]